MTFFSLSRFMASTFSSRCRSMNGPFFSERPIVDSQSFSKLLVGPHPHSPAQRRSYVAGLADYFFVLAGPHPRSPARRRSYVAGLADYFFLRSTMKRSLRLLLRVL